MYYLNSRYYNPELGRFISADDFSYLDTASELSLNLYAYCWNCPVAFHDTEGKAPEISINLNDIISLMKNISLEIKNGIKERYDKLNQLVTNWKNSIKQRMTAFFEKFEFMFTYPDAVVNTALSAAKSIGAEVKSKLVQQIRDRFTLLFTLNKQNSDNDEETVELSLKRAKSSSSTTTDDNNIVMAILQGLVAAIEFDWINDILEFFGSSLSKLAQKTFEGVKQISLLFMATINTVFGYLKDVFSFDIISIFDSLILEEGEKMALEFDLIDAKGVGKGFGAFISIFIFFSNVDSAGSGAFTKTEDNIMNAISLVIDIACLFVGPVAGVLIPLISNLVIDISAILSKGLIFNY